MENKKSFFEKLKLVDRIDKESLLEEKEIENTYIDTHNEAVNKNENISVNQNTSSETIELSSKEIEDDRLLSIDEIYTKANLESKKVNTIFLVDSYVKALPENLPTEIKRQSVLNIIKASDMSIGTLINDGQSRLNILNEFTTSITTKTDDIVKDCEEKIKELYKRIDEYKKSINERQKFQEEQKACIDYEVQKVQSILDFIK